MYANLLLRPELVPQRTRLTCRITIDAPLRGIKTDAWRDYAMRETKRAYEQFIRDTEKQGWRHVPAGAPNITGPLSHIDPLGVPKRPNVPKRRPGTPSVSLHKVDTTDWDYYTDAPTPVVEQDRWDYEFSEIFVRQMLVEVPDIGPRSEMTLAEYLKRSAN